MLRFLSSVTMIAVAGVLVSSNATPVETLNKNYSRTKSSVLVRKIASPTLANLDYAAYNANVVRFDPESFNPKAPKVVPTLAELTFGGTLASVCDSINGTPLTDEEKNKAMAWAPMQNRIWSAVKTDAFAKLAGKINSDKWGDPAIFKPYQEVTAAYLHDNHGASELWVRVEFAPWVKFLKNIPDLDKDGFKKIYGRLDLSGIDTVILKKTFNWIRTEYCGKELKREDIVDWENILASYWYPVLNTDIVDMTGQTQWPTAETEKNIVKEVKGLVVKDPVAVIRGKPFQKPIYNVFVIEGMATAEVPKPEVPVSATAATAGLNNVSDKVISANFKQNTGRFAQEVKDNGSYDVWAKKSASFTDSLTKLIKALPADQLGFKGKDSWLFFRKSVDFLLGGDLANQAKDKNALPHLADLKKYLDAHNVNLLFVPVPNKEEVYFDKLPVTTTAGFTSYTNPYSRKILADMQAAGIEVIDLLPEFIKAKADDSKSKEPVYQWQDTHWTNRGLQIAAEKIAQRIKEYSWYQDALKNKVVYSATDTTFPRLGDIVDKLPEAQRTAFPEVQLHAKVVKNAEGVPFKSTPSAPILLMGDSFTGVFELIDCKNAGVGAHIAQKTSLPLDIITSWGGGPMVRQKMIRSKQKTIGQKRLVVYMMVARDLYNYSQLWEPIDTTVAK